MTESQTKLQKLTGWIFLGLLVILPFGTTHVFKQPFAISYINIVAVTFIIVSALTLLTGKLKLEKIGNRSLTILIALMTLMLIWGTFFSEPLRSALGPWTSRFLQPLIVGYLGFLLVRQNIISIKHIAWAFWISLILVDLLGLAQLTGIVDTNNPGRLTGFYFFPNTFARYVEILLLLTLPHLLLGKNNPKLLFGLAWLVGVVMLLATKSYAGAASFAFGVMAIVLFLPAEFKRLKLTVLLIILFGLLGALIFRESLPKYQVTITGSLKSRQQYWVIGWETIKDHPLTGIGLEGWENKYLGLARTYIDESKEPLIETVSAQPHNIFLDGWLRGGIFGLIAISYLLLWPIAVSFTVLRQNLVDEANRPFVLGLFGYGVAMILFGLIDDPIFSDDTMLLVFVLYFGLVAAIKKGAANVTPRPGS